jgi:hypothetical protein
VRKTMRHRGRGAENSGHRPARIVNRVYAGFLRYWFESNRFDLGFGKGISGARKILLTRFLTNRILRPPGATL